LKKIRFEEEWEKAFGPNPKRIRRVELPISHPLDISSPGNIPPEMPNVQESIIKVIIGNK